MLKYVIKRVLFMLLTFFIIISMCFILIRLLPNVPAQQFGKDMSLILQRRVRQGLVDVNGNPIPLMQQYWHFITKTLLGGDWGVSEALYVGQDCWQIFVSKLPFTISINVYSIILSIPLGIALGIFAALKKNKWQDHVISTGVIILVSVPSYVYAFLVQYFLCFKLKLFPIIMNAGTDLFNPTMIRSMMPAVISMALGSIAGFARYTRAELTEVLTSEYLLLARTKGLTRAQTTVRHALRNSMVPIFPMIIGEFIGVLGGSLIIESIFGVPGTGALYINSITALDYNFFILLSGFYTIIGLSANILVDISYGFIDPRIRMGSRK